MKLLRTACGRRSKRQQLPDAVPGGHQPGAGGAAVLHRDDRNGSSLSCGTRRRLLAGSGDGKQNGAIDRIFEPELSKEERDEKMNGWHKAVRYAEGWAK